MASSWVTLEHHNPTRLLKSIDDVMFKFGTLHWTDYFTPNHPLCAKIPAWDISEGEMIESGTNSYRLSSRRLFEPFHLFMHAVAGTSATVSRPVIGRAYNSFSLGVASKTVFAIESPPRNDVSDSRLISDIQESMNGLWVLPVVQCMFDAKGSDEVSSYFSRVE